MSSLVVGLIGGGGRRCKGSSLFSIIMKNSRNRCSIRLLRTILPKHRQQQPIMQKKSCFDATRRPKQIKICYYHELSFTSHGDPLDVLHYQKPTITTSMKNDINMETEDDNDMVHVNMVYAPWNPADINTVQGKYPSPYNNNKMNNYIESIRSSQYFDSSLVAGSEGLGYIEIPSDGNNSKMDKKWVVIAQPGFGTLRSSLYVPKQSILPIPDDFNVVGDGDNDDDPKSSNNNSNICTLLQLGGTAYRLLYDFIRLQSGEVIIQNAGSSGVGLLASQLVSEYFNCSMVSIVRRGTKTIDQYDSMVEHLTTIGKNKLIISEEELLSSKETLKSFKNKLRDLNESSQQDQLPRLALNAIGGDNASKLLLGCLEPGIGSTMVTYGGMSQRPIIVPTSRFIFQDIHLVGYWHSRWMVQQQQQQQQQQQVQQRQSQQKQKQQSLQEMWIDLLQLVQKKQLQCPPCHIFKLNEWEGALQSQIQQDNIPIRHKIVFDCQE